MAHPRRKHESLKWRDRPQCPPFAADLKVAGQPMGNLRGGRPPAASALAQCLAADLQELVRRVFAGVGPRQLGGVRPDRAEMRRRVLPPPRVCQRVRQVVAVHQVSCARCRRWPSQRASAWSRSAWICGRSSCGVFLSAPPARRGSRSRSTPRARTAADRQRRPGRGLVHRPVHELEHLPVRPAPARTQVLQRLVVPSARVRISGA